MMEENNFWYKVLGWILLFVYFGLMIIIHFALQKNASKNYDIKEIEKEYKSEDDNS